MMVLIRRDIKFFDLEDEMGVCSVTEEVGDLVEASCHLNNNGNANK